MTYQQEAQHYSLPNSRLIGFGIMSLLFSLTVVLAPLPITLVFLLYGRMRGFLLGSLILVLCYYLAPLNFFVQFMGEGTLFPLNAMGFIFAICISEIVHRSLSPMKGIFLSGMILLIGASLFFVGTLNLQNKSVKEAVIQKIEANRDAIEGYKENLKMAEPDNEIIPILDQPEEFAERLLTIFPGYLSGVIFFILWVNLMLALKFEKVIEVVRRKKLRFNTKTLLHFKVPDHMIWLVIASLVMVLWGERLNDAFAYIGFALIIPLGFFYFFQGFGIYIGFLDSMGIRGLLRSVLVIVTVFTAFQVIALIGLFDMFINFRRFFQKKS